MITGAAADWLRKNRDGLNQRVRLARHQGGRPDGALLGTWLERLLPALCAGGARDGLLLATFDLVLLLAAHGRLPQPELADADAHGRLLGALPGMVAALDVRPGMLAAFSNAVGNLGAGGSAFAAALPALAAACPPEQLAEAGAILAWRVGEPRLRQRALTIAAGLPVAATAVALDVDEAQAAAALAKLTANAWRRPCAGGQLVQIGDYLGFGGPFAMPPLLLGTAHGHCLRVQCGEHRHRIDADVFGWRCVTDPDPGGVPVRGKVPDAATPLIAGAASWIMLQPGVLACTRADSFRIRIHTVEPA